MIPDPRRAAALEAPATVTIDLPQVCAGVAIFLVPVGVLSPWICGAVLLWGVATADPAAADIP